jgi:lipopolysaccharide transport system ATP-binding protein
MPGIRVDLVSKRFRRFAKDRPHTFQEALLGGFRNLFPQDTFWALKDVSLEVGSGEMVGVIGRNGAGKTSLLRLVGGIGKPDEGEITTAGRLGALIDLGAGFHPELTGRENATMNAVIAGFRRRDAQSILDEIVNFAELEAFFDSPLRTYSTGMQLRLAFSVAVHLRPEALLVDEVLAVGDLGFQQKCLERIQELRSQGTAILFVTHNLEQAQQLCDRIIWLEAGREMAYGDAAEVVEAYRETAQLATRQRTPNNYPDQKAADGAVLRVNENRFGSLEIMLQQVRVLDDAGSPVEALAMGQGLRVEMAWQATKPVEEVIFSAGIIHPDNTVACEVYTPAGRLIAERGNLCVTFDRLDLPPGPYFVDVGAYPADWSGVYDLHKHVYPLLVEGESGSKGSLRPPYRWKIEAGKDPDPAT